MTYQEKIGQLYDIFLCLEMATDVNTYYTDIFVLIWFPHIQTIRLELTTSNKKHIRALDICNTIYEHSQLIQSREQPTERQTWTHNK